MKLLKPLLISIQSVIISTWLWGAAEADPKPCSELVRPLHKQVNQIRDQGGIWAQFEKRSGLQNHSPLALRLDSKIIGLIFTLDYLCTTQEGIPYHEIAQYVVPKIKAKGEEGFIKEHVALGHSLKDVTDWVEFAKFSENNLNRKLDLNQIGKTVEQAGPHVERYVLLFQNKNSVSVTIAEAKALTKDIEQLRATDPYLKQADYENSQIPHSSALSNTGDEM